MENRWAQQAISFSGVPFEITDQENELERTWEMLNKASHRHPDSSALQSEKLLTNQKRNHFFRELKAHYPRYYQLKYESPPPVLSSI